MAAGGVTHLQDSKGENFTIKVEATEQNNKVTSMTISDEVYFNDELKYKAKRISDTGKHTFWVEITWNGSPQPETKTVSIINKDGMIFLSKLKPKKKSKGESSCSSRFQSFKEYIVSKLNEPDSPPKNETKPKKDVQQSDKKTKELDADSHREYEPQQATTGDISVKQTLDLQNNVPEMPAEMTQILPANDNAEALKYVEILNKCGLKIELATFEANISTHKKWETWKSKLLAAEEEELDFNVLIEISEVLQQNRHRKYDSKGAYDEFKEFASRHAQFVSYEDFTKMADKHSEWKTAFEKFDLHKFSSAIIKETEDFLVRRSFKHAMGVCRQYLAGICLQQFSAIVKKNTDIQEQLFTMRGYSEFLMSLEGRSFLRECRKVEVAKSN